MSAALEFRDVDILFPREHGRKGERALTAALAMLDAGATREQIAERHRRRASASPARASRSSRARSAC